MELMSSLLLCVLVTLLPQTSGRSRVKPGQSLDIKFNNSIYLKQKPKLRKHILLNINGPPLVNNVTELQSVFTDVYCKRCHDCMERAIKADKILTHMMSNRPSAEELQEDVLTNEISYRTKRDIAPTDHTVPETATETRTTKKKSRKHRQSKSVTVTKYNIDGEVYALRVKEIQANPDTTPEVNNDSLPLTTCQIYNVKKTYSCDSPESDSLLAAARRKVTKRKPRKQEQDKIKSSSTTAATLKAQTQSVFRKREVDNSQVPENFMPSIEELY